MSLAKLRFRGFGRDGGHGSAVRVGVFAAVLVAVAALPFVFVGEAFEAFSAAALTDRRGSVVVALLGIALLASDVLLPVPSSLVGSALGALLGFAAGTIVAVIGLTVGCVLGFAFGRVAGRTIARRRLGPDDQWLTDLLQRYGAPVLVVTRGVPVVAEASIIAAGVLGMAPIRCFAATTIGNVGVAAVYAYLGAAAMETSAAWVFIAIVLVPGLMLAAVTAIRWTIFRMSGGDAGRPGWAP